MEIAYRQGHEKTRFERGGTVEFLHRSKTHTRRECFSTAVLLKICTALKCDVADIMEIIPDGSSETEELPRERI
jgi:hypothetical protein